MASRSLGSLTLDLVLRMGGFQAGMDKAARESEKNLKRIQATARGVGAAIGGLFAAIGSAQLVGAIIRNTEEADAALAQLQARIKSTGNVAGVSIPDLQDFASELQGLTTYGDDAILAMQGVLLTFTNIRGGAVKDATRAILDLSTAMGSDLQSSALLVGKALNDPVKGATALSRAGVQLSEDQKKLIKSFVDLGDVASAQNIILGELQTQFGGAAEAAAGTFGGAIKQLHNAFGDLLEAKGGVGEATGAIQDLTGLLRDPSTVQAAETLTSSLVRGFGAAAAAISDVVNVARFAGEELARIRFGAAADDIAGMERELQKLQDIKATLAANPLDRLRFFGKDGVVEWYSNADLDREMARLKGQLADAYKGFPSPVAAPATGATPTSAGPVATPPSEAFEKLSAQLREQIALHGETSEAAKLSYQIQTGAIEDITAAEGRRLIGLASQLDALKDSAEIAREQAKEWQSLTAEIERAGAQAAADLELPALEDLNREASDYFDTVERGVSLTEELRTPQEQYNDALREMDELLDAGVISQETHARGAKQALDDLNKDINTFYDEAKRNAQDILGQGIYDSLKDGFDRGAGEALNTFADMLLRMATEAIAADIMGAIFKGSAGNGSSSGDTANVLAGLFGSFLGGARAMGGPVAANTPYLVGERGPEIIVPKSAGNVVPNKQLGGMSVVQNFTIQAPSGSVSRQTQQQVAASAARGIGRANQRNN